MILKNLIIYFKLQKPFILKKRAKNYKTTY